MVSWALAHGFLDEIAESRALGIAVSVWLLRRGRSNAFPIWPGARQRIFRCGAKRNLRHALDIGLAFAEPRFVLMEKVLRCRAGRR